MSLSKAKVEVLFTKGVNNKSDDKTVLNSDLLALENRVFTKYAALDKRYGYTQLGNKDCSTKTAITNARGLADYKKSLILMADDKLYDYSPSASEWLPKGALTSASVRLRFNRPYIGA